MAEKKINKLIHPEFEGYTSEISKCIENFSNTGTLIYGGDRNQIRCVNIAGNKFNIKSFKTPNIFNSIVYRYIRPSKAKRSYEFALKLLKLGISTPQPVAYFEVADSLGLGKSFYVSKHIDYDLDFRVLIHNQDYPERERILELFTEFTFQLHEKGVNFLDHSPGNTLIKKTTEAYKFYLIDLNRMRFEKMNLNDRMYNFRRLWLSKAMIRIIAKKYAELYGKPYAEIHNLMLKHSRQFQKKINQKKLRRSGRRPRFKSK